MQTQWNKNNPFFATIAKRERLSSSLSVKNTYHIELSIQGSGIAYECGDTLGVLPENHTSILIAIAHHFQIPLDTQVVLPKHPEPLSFHDALHRFVAIDFPTRALLNLILQHSDKNSNLHETISTVLNSDENTLSEYIHSMHVLDLAQEYTGAAIPAQAFIESLRRLQPRLYSIASSPLVYPHQIHLTVDSLVYKLNDRPRLGVASYYLAINPKTEIPIFVTKSNFKMPVDPHTDYIMIGPGVGVAPFRGFLQQHEAEKRPARTWLFFGNPHQQDDFLYHADWEHFRHNKTLTMLDCAFSRDQDKKIYVQHKLLERASEIAHWIHNGAAIYICGSASPMAKDVEQTLLHIIETHLNLSPEAAKTYLADMKKAKRYQKDVY